jgi:large subunit ribosomal protein L32
MGIQKRRRSKMSGANRRAHWKIRPISLVACPNCHAQMRPHRACPNCGQYAGREVIKVEKPESK